MSQERPDDLMCPPQPREAYFDAGQGIWVLSRYADVTAALCEPRLNVDHGAAPTERPVDSRSWIGQAGRSQMKLAPLAHHLLAALPQNRPINILSEFAEGWCFALACEITGADPSDKYLLDLARRASRSVSGKTAAHQELERRIPGGFVPMPAAAFLALAQTLPALLANAWLALLRHPEEFSRLARRADLLPAALEELLRYAGLARIMYRTAAADLRLGEVTIREGQRAALLFQSANRDPAQFADPNRLDLTRRAPRHLAFGAGPHSCIAAPLIRMAAATATSAFIEHFPNARAQEPVEWRDGAGFRAPAALWIMA